MARTIATNFTGGLQFPYATAAGDIFKKEDVQTLAAAVDQHTHGAGKGLVLGAGAIPSGFVLPSPHFTSPAIDSGNLTFGAATAIINGGATSLVFNNNANTATNLTISDAGTVTIGRANLAFTPAAAVINGGSSSLNFNNNANNATNLAIADTGAAVLRAGLTVNSDLVLNNFAVVAVGANQIGLGATVASSATAGANGAVPAAVAGYWIINVNGANQKVPYYNV